MKFKVGDLVKLSPRIINFSNWWEPYQIEPYTDCFEILETFSGVGHEVGHIFRNVRNNIHIQMYDRDMLPYDGKPYDPIIDRIYKTYAQCKTTAHWKRDC